MVDAIVLPSGRNCTVCKQWKSIENFWISSRDGVLGRCKACTLEYGRKYRQANRDKMNARNRARVSALAVYRKANVVNIPLVTDEGRLCSKCQTRLPLGSFGPDKGRKDGLSRRCRDCKKMQHTEWRQRNADHIREQARLNREKNYWADPVDARDRSIRTKYRISKSDIKILLSEQGGVCAICKSAFSHTWKSNKRMCVDHCHSSLKVRGLLCNACNTAIGMLYDDPDLAESAAAYLRNTK